MTGKITMEQKWHEQSEAAKNEAEKLPHGKERDGGPKWPLTERGQPSPNGLIREDERMVNRQVLS